MIVMCLMLRKFFDVYVFILGLLIMYMEYNLMSVYFILCISIICYVVYCLVLFFFLMSYEYLLY